MRESPVADNPPAESAAESILQMIRRGSSLGIGHSNGCMSDELDAMTRDGLLIDGESPDVLPVVWDYLAEEDPISSLMQLLD